MHKTVLVLCLPHEYTERIRTYLTTTELDVSVAALDYVPKFVSGNYHEVAVMPAEKSIDYFHQWGGQGIVISDDALMRESLLATEQAIAAVPSPMDDSGWLVLIDEVLSSLTDFYPCTKSH